MSGASVLRPGDALGDYVVEAITRERAFTVTYRARERALGRSVSIHALKATVAPTSAYADAILREAAALEALDAPSFPALFALHRSAAELYLVVPEPRGITLEEIAAKGRLDALAAAAIAAALGEAMQRAHAAGVVHRALDASCVRVHRGEILVDGFDRATSPKMADVVALGGDAPDRGDARDVGCAAPEITRGDKGDARSDVYSIGAIAASLVSGESPSAIARAFEKSTALLPEDRFQDAASFAAAMSRALGLSTSASPRAVVERALAALGVEGAPATADVPRARARSAGPSLSLAARNLFGVFALIVFGALAIESFRGDAGAASPSPEATHERGYLRVVARPWAEVYVDGDHVETTPFARPIALTPGRHFVVLKHPRAPDEPRPVTITAGRTVLLDVAMQVPRPAVDASASDAGEPTP